MWGGGGGGGAENEVGNFYPSVVCYNAIFIFQLVPSMPMPMDRSVFILLPCSSFLLPYSLSCSREDGLLYTKTIIDVLILHR